MQEAPAATFSKVIMWSGPSLEDMPSMRARTFFLQASLQSKVVSVMKEKCSEAREGGSANSATKEHPFDLEWHPLVHNAQKAVESLIWYSCLLLENFRFSTVLRRLGRITSFPAFCRKPQVSSAEFT